MATPCPRHRSADETRELEVAGAQTKTLAIGAGPKAESTTPGPTRPAEVGGGLGLVRILGIVVGGVGVVGLVTGTATGVMSNGKFATLEEECGGARCTDPKYADDVDSGKSLELVANVTLIAGAVLAAASVPMIIFGGPSDEVTTTWGSRTASEGPLPTGRRPGSLPRG